jgi:hypothetical protein
MELAAVAAAAARPVAENRLKRLLLLQRSRLDQRVQLLATFFSGSGSLLTTRTLWYALLAFALVALLGPLLATRTLWYALLAFAVVALLGPLLATRTLWYALLAFALVALLGPLLATRTLSLSIFPRCTVGATACNTYLVVCTLGTCRRCTVR